MLYISCNGKHRQVAIEPNQGPFDDPAPRQQLKADSVSGAFDDLDGPLAEFGESFGQVGAVVDTVGEEMAQPGKGWTASMTSTAPSRSWTSAGCTAAPTSRPQVSVTMWRLRPLIFLAASPGSRFCRARGQAPPRGPPLSVVLAD